MGIGLVGSLVGGVASGVGSIVGANDVSDAASAAAAAQQQAAQQAIASGQQYYGEAKSALSPYMAVGSQAAGQLGNQLTSLTTPVSVPTMTQADLEATPGYQFTLGQGLKATQNSAAARGLGASGAALKGAASYATGLSDNTYNTRFNQAQTQFQDNVTNQSNDFNRLYQTTGLGSGAAGTLAGDAVATGGNIANAQTGAGNATAAADLTAGKAQAAAATGVAGSFNNALQQYMAGGSSMYGSPSDSTQPTVGGKYFY